MVSSFYTCRFHFWHSLFYPPVKALWSRPRRKCGQKRVDGLSVGECLRTFLLGIIEGKFCPFYKECPVLGFVSRRFLILATVALFSVPNFSSQLRISAAPHLSPVTRCPLLSFLLPCLLILAELWCCLGLAMASSSQRNTAQAPGAAPPPLPPPPPEDLAAFYTLLEKRVTAGVLRRHTRAAELSERAAKHAARLWGDNSLVVADQLVCEAVALRGMASASTSSSEKEALWRRAWAILVPVHALLLRRLADNTVLPGTNTEDEVTYDARVQVFVCKATNKTVPSEAVLRGQGVVLGYTTLLGAVFNTLALLMELRGSALPRESAHSFVLTSLDAIPRTATMQHQLMSEAHVVAMMETRLMPHNFEPSFCAAVLRKWRSSAVADVLRARGSLQNGVAANQEGVAEFKARQRADIEKVGLRECAWPSCDKVERTVREFKQCSGCRSVWYCSLEHHTLDWGAHRKDCQKLDKARRAAMAAGGEASGAAP